MSKNEVNPGKLELDFWQFHTDNPHIYTWMVHYARQWKLYYEHGSIALLCERLRWHRVETRSHDNFKINNNHKAFYSRLLEEQEPDLNGFFRKRQQRIQCTFGPLNEDLPSGRHIA